MAVYGAQNYTSFSGVNIKGSVAIRVGNQNDAFVGTLSIKGASLDGSREWHFPDKSGNFPISGTFLIQLPAATAVYFSTAVTVSGITVEDGLVVTMSEKPGTTSYTFGGQGTAYVLERAQPGVGAINLFFRNPGNATGYIELIGHYTAVR